MTERTRFVGLDVHKQTIAIAVAEEGEQPHSFGTIANQPAALRRLVSELGRDRAVLKVAYEARPTGFAAHRLLTRLQVSCMVVAPALIPRRPGDRVKNDRRDALMLARLLRGGDLTPIWIPDEAHEALRSLVRARADAKVDELRARHRLSKFLLRLGHCPPPGTKAWTFKHSSWLDQLQFTQAADQVTFRYYRTVVDTAKERVKELDRELEQFALASPQLPLLAALQSLRGVGFLTA